jgi:hypothetical protein
MFGPGRVSGFDKRSSLSTSLLACDRVGNVTGADFVIDGGLITTV